MKVKVLEGGFLPAKAYRGDAGWDIKSPEDHTFAPHEYKWFGLGISINIPQGYGAQIITRSSLTNKGLFSSPAFVDSGYLGEIHFAGINLSDKPITVLKGERFCSIVVYKLSEDTLEQVDHFDEEYDRRFKGTGSSGKGV